MVDIVLRKKVNFDEGITFAQKIHLWEVLQVVMLMKTMLEKILQILLIKILQLQMMLKRDIGKGMR